MQSKTNHDIWSEVLQYFKVNIADDSIEDIQLKRRTTLSVALTHPDLVDVALDELWRSMVSLEPIVRVLNATFTEPIVALEYDQNLGFWNISLPVNGTDPFLRARRYLSRIQYLHFATYPAQRECTLWAAIFSLGQISPVCPGLRKLFLGSGLSAAGTIYNLALLASPALQSVIFASTISGDSGAAAAISTLLNSFRCRDVQLCEISYHGFVSPRIIQHIFEIPTLRSVAIQPDQPNLGSADIQSFCGMENLTKLDIHLGIFQRNASVGDWLTRMPSLLTLHLSGSWKDIYVCIRHQNYRSLQSLSLSLDPLRTIGTPPAAQRMQQDTFSRISVAFPSLRSLYITLRGNQSGHAVMTILDILALREKPLEALEMRHLPTSLSTIDVIDVLTVWPSLRRLSIVPPATHRFVCEAKAILSYMSNHAPKLQGVDLPLDFSSLVTPPLPSPQRCACPLQKLELSQALRLPQSLPGTLTLCRNLITLFPRLTVVTSPDSNSNGTNDLQAVINLVQDILASPPKRYDHLF